MPETVWTLIAVAVGGTIPVLGKIISDWQLARREAKLAWRDRLRDNIYELQDVVEQLDRGFALASPEHELEVRANESVPGSPTVLGELQELSQIAQKAETLILRIGDSVLQQQFTALMRTFFALAATSVKSTARLEAARQVLDAYADLNLRLRNLLHDRSEPHIKRGDDVAWRPWREAQQE